LSTPSGRERCSFPASSHGARIHTSHSSGVVRITGMALGWFGPTTRRLVIDDQGAVSVYDTGNHRIFGVAQAQSSDRTLSFTSQDGLVRVADLPKVAV
jgi:hypothetical protein